MVTDTQAKVTDTQMKVTDTQTMVADMHRNMLAGQEGTPGQNRLVRVPRYQSIHNAYRFPGWRQVSDTECNGVPNLTLQIACLLVNYLPRHRGTASGATN